MNKIVYISVILKIELEPRPDRSQNVYSDIVKQGNNIGNKLSNQQAKWSNETFRRSLSNIALIHHSHNAQQILYLGLVDTFDVSISEKITLQNAMQNNCTNSSNVVLINNKTNI